jgi:hypothetical protein
LLYLGSTNRLSLAGTTDRHPTVGEVGSVLQGATRELAAGLQDAEVVTVRIGHRPVTSDRLPLVGPTALDRVHVITGAYRNGIVLAPRLAELLTLELQDPGSIDKHAFSTGRPTSPPADLEQLIEDSGGGLGTFLADFLERWTDPEGLEVVARQLLRLAYSTPSTRRRIQRILGSAPLAEALPLALEALVRQR